MNAAPWSPPWLALTPSGALHAYGCEQPDPQQRALQALLGGDRTLAQSQWLQAVEPARQLLPLALSQGWVEPLARPVEGPDVRLDDFVQHVIASLSAQRQAVLASESGFCLGRAGVPQDEADLLSAAAADFAGFAQRQQRRGWPATRRYASFHADAQMLLPQVSLVPFWVDAVGYWLILCGEPLLNSPALVELIWGIQEAGTRFQPPPQ